MSRKHIFPCAPVRCWRSLFVALCLGLALPAWAQDEAQRFLDLATQRFEDGDAAGAVIEVKNALQQRSDLPEAHLLLARIYLKLGLGAAAEEALKRAGELGISADRTLLLKARLLLQQQRHEALLAQIDADAAPEGLRASLLVYRGHALVALEREDEAERAYSRAATLEPLFAEPRIASARLALTRGDVFRAERRAHEAVAADASSGDARVVMGDVLQARGRLEEALSAYNAALERIPGALQPQAARIGVLLALDRLPAAESALERLAEIAPEEPRVHFLRANLLRRLGRTDQAAASVERARDGLRAMDDATLRRSGPLLMLAALTSLEAGRYETARAYLGDYLARFPRRLEARRLMAIAGLRQGEVAQAIKDLEALVAEHGKSPRVLATLAEAYRRSGRPRRAHELVRQALELDPDDTAIQAQRALSLLALGQGERAMSMLERLFREVPSLQPRIGARLASLHLERGDGDAALAVTRALVRRDARDADLLNLHGTALLMSGDRAGARSAFDGALTLDPAHAGARINASNLLASGGREDEATSLLAAGLEHKAQRGRIMLAMSAAEQRRGDLAAAERWLVEAREAEPGSVGVVSALVRFYLSSNRADDGLRVAIDALETAPDSAALLRVAARAHLSLGQTQEAVALYRKLSGKAIGDVRAQYRVAGELAAAGAFEEASEVLARVLRLDPDHVPAHIRRIEVLERMGQAVQAEEAIEKLLSERAGRPGVLEAIGRLYLARREFGRAVAVLERAHEDSPGTIVTVALSNAYAGLGDRGRARETLAGWLSEHPADHAVRGALARANLDAGNLVAARDGFQSLLDAGQVTAPVLNNLAYVMGRLGQTGAVELARRAHALRPADPAIADTLGWLLLREGRPTEALPVLEQARDASRSQPTIGFHLAQALAATGRREEARAELEAALASPRTFPERGDAEALLDTLR